MPHSPVSIDVSEGVAITVFESDHDGKCGYATRLWDCSVGLSRWMLESLPPHGPVVAALPSERPLKGWRVLEVGAGTALCSLAILLAEPDCQVIATDVDPASLPLIRAAAEVLYKSHGRGLENLQSLLVDITAAGTALPDCDLLIASDACYTTELATALANRCVQALQASPTARVVIADPGRPGQQTLTDALAAAGYGAIFEKVGDRRAAGAACPSFAEWLGAPGGGKPTLGRCPRIRLLQIEDDARLWGVSCVPAMF